MKTLLTLLCLVLALISGGRSGSDEYGLEETCAAVFDSLKSGPYVTLSMLHESFEYDGTRYDGCVIRLSGDVTTMTPAQSPDALFGDNRPYCPDGEPIQETDARYNEEGWCADRMADGPDGTSYRAFGDGVFCVVDSRWDGGDDSDPQYEPDPAYETVVRCALR